MCAQMYRCIHLPLYVFAHELKMQRRASRFIHAYKSTFMQLKIRKNNSNKTTKKMKNYKKKRKKIQKVLYDPTWSYIVIIRCSTMYIWAYMAAAPNKARPPACRLVVSSLSPSSAVSTTSSSLLSLLWASLSSLFSLLSLSSLWLLWGSNGGRSRQCTSICAVQCHTRRPCCCE